VSRLARLALYAGTALCVAGLSKAHAVTHAYSWSGSSRLAWSLGYVALLSVAAYGFGLPEQPRNRRAALLAAIGATAAAALSVSVLQLVSGDALLPRFVVFGSAVVLVPWYVLCSYLAGDARTRAGARDRVLVVADPDEIVTLEAELKRASERAAVLLGCLPVGAATSTSMPPHRPLLEAARAEGATVVVISRAAQADDDVVMQASILHEEGVRVRTLSLFYEQWLGKLPIGELERASLLFDIGELHAAGYARVKRLLDVALATLGFVALAIVTPIVLVGDVLANRGPLFFRQPRTGRNGSTFEILKFRTMRVGTDGSTDAQANDWTAENDARITPFGRALRRTHLDELPQVVNVLRGELSVVGPRPEQPQVVDELVDKLPFYRLRHLVRPGLTGWAQVKFHYAGNEEETLEKLQYEFYYLRRQSLALDLRIVGRTLRAVIGREGR
jgi:lipopolysaccharide/colanic/teichoic acid biosynthesis glycosyltransferase